MAFGGRGDRGCHLDGGAFDADGPLRDGFLLARGLSNLLGSLYPVVSPCVGILGASATAATTTQTYLFGSLQKNVALFQNIDPCIRVAVKPPKVANITFGGSITYSPYKLCVGPDDTLYVGDSSSGSIGGVWRTDPNLINSTNIFGLASPSTNKTTFGTNFGRAIGTPNVSGSLANGNLVLTLTSWDLNLANSSGQFGASASGYQNIYQYNIGSGPLPWHGFPAVLQNPIALGTVNGVLMDVEIAPDGKYFITAHRQNPSDGSTNVCVLNSGGTTVLWDSKTQSAAYFGDTVNDHLSIQNYSIAVSPDDNYVVIQGGANNSFLLMALTNGVPNIATLSTNMKVGTGGGGTCYAAAWDAADNIYVTSGGSDTLEIFSLGLTTTCVTSNDLTCTNGGFQMTSSGGTIGQDNAQLLSVSLAAGTYAMPRTTFIQTWTMTNTGITTWTPGPSGYTLNLVGLDSLGAIPFSNNLSAWCIPMASLQNGAPVPREEWAFSA